MRKPFSATTRLFAQQSRLRTRFFSRCFSSSSDHKNTSSPTTICDVIQGPSLLRTPVARPSPSLMFLPGLRSLPFWTSPDHSQVAYRDETVTRVVQHLESHIETIRNEYLRVAPTLKSDYEETDMGSSLHQGTWEWFSYLNKGSVQGHFALHFPETAKLLQELRNEQLLFEGTPFGFCFFSVLHGNASIQAHTAPMNMRLRIHLPLVVPKNSSDTTPTSEKHPTSCGIRVGPIVRPWVENKALVLDDSYDHEVWNHTEEKRVLLLVDMWHPDVTLAEKKEIVELFQNAKKEGMWKR